MKKAGDVGVCVLVKAKKLNIMATIKPFFASLKKRDMTLCLYVPKLLNLHRFH